MNSNDDLQLNTKSTFIIHHKTSTKDLTSKENIQTPLQKLQKIAKSQDEIKRLQASLPRAWKPKYNLSLLRKRRVCLLCFGGCLVSWP
jgi:hypothetical protein